jgi:lysophospholipase L1-like esterase
MRRWPILCLVLPLLGCNSGAVSKEADVPGDTPRYLALGDSYTCGESVDGSDRYPVQLVKRLRAAGITVADPRIIAVTGWTTDELMRGMDQEQPQGPYALVSLLIGVNNQFRGRSQDEYRTQFVTLLKRAIDLAGGKASRVVVLSIPDWGVTPFAEGRDRAKIGGEIDQFNAIAQQETLKLGAAFVDITGISRRATQSPDLIANDGLHPSGKMYGLWVDAALPVARKAMEK